MRSNGWYAARWLVGAALVIGVALGYIAHGAVARPGTGTVEATWSCTSSACGDWKVFPSLAFSQGSCPRYTIAMSDAHGSDIRVVLPAGTYNVNVLLGNARMVPPLNHRTVSVVAGKTVHLGVMTIDARQTPYPMFCD